jgi:hypothetical protein
MDIKEYLIKNKPTAITTVIVLSLILGIYLIKKITLWLQYLIEANGLTPSFPAWFINYGIGFIGFLIAVLMIWLINWSFMRYLKTL